MNVRKAKTCERCGVVFSPNSNRQRCCSPQCTIRFLSTVDAAGCWIWHGPIIKTGMGYGTYQINGVRTTAHRLSYIHFKGPIPDGQEVCHRCDMPACVNPEHLFLGTRKENMVDCAKKGRNTRKLTEADVLAIRRTVGMTKAALGRQYGVTEVMIGKIIRGEWWKDVAQVAPDAKGTLL